MKTPTINFQLNSSGVNSFPIQVIVNLGGLKNEQGKNLRQIVNIGISLSKALWDKKKGLPVDRGLAGRLLNLEARIQSDLQFYEDKPDQEVIDGFQQGKIKNIIKKAIDKVIHNQQDDLRMDLNYYKPGEDVYNELMKFNSSIGNNVIPRLNQYGIRLIDSKGREIDPDKFFNWSITDLKDMYMPETYIQHNNAGKISTVEEDKYPILFWEYVLMVAEYKKKQIKDTLGEKSDAGYKNLSNKIKAFDCNLTLGRYTDAIGVDFLNFVKENYNIESANSFGRIIALLSAVLTFAIEKDKYTWGGKKAILPNVDLSDSMYDKMSEEVDNVYINEQILQHIAGVELDCTIKEYIRDLFIVGSYTGVRFGNLKSVFNIMYDKNNDYYYLNFADEKTNTRGKIPIPNFVHSILAKYNFEFTEITNQEFNRVIKDVFKDCGYTDLYHYSQYSIKTNKVEEYAEPFHKLVYAHSMRRNFATNMFYHRKIDKRVVMAITKHKKEDTFDRYLKMKEVQLIDEYVKKFIQVENQKG